MAGKEHLYQGVVEQMFVAMTTALRGALESPDGPREKLLAFLDANFKVLARQPAYARLLERDRPALIVEGSLGGELAAWLKERRYALRKNEGSPNIVAQPLEWT